jgi:hypothetical protein
MGYRPYGGKIMYNHGDIIALKFKVEDYYQNDNMKTLVPEPGVPLSASFLTRSAQLEEATNNGNCFLVKAAPIPLKVGDRVYWVANSRIWGTIISVVDDKAWIKWDGSTDTVEHMYCIKRVEKKC